MARPSRELADDLRRKLHGLEITRRRAEKLRRRRKIAIKDVDRTYDALFVRAVALFEVFIEELFLGLLVEGGGLRAPSKARVTARIKVNSKKIAREVVVGPGRDFVNWLNYDGVTRELAKVHFTDGRPFTGLERPLIIHLQECSWIRNAIAHQGPYSKSQFESHVSSGIALAPRSRSPAGYLRSQYSAHPPQTRYEYHIAELERTALALAT